jgi:hypothetical protein
MTLAFWNNGAPIVVEDRSKVRMPNGDVVFAAVKNPARDLFEYVVAAATPTRYQRVVRTDYAKSGDTITATPAIEYLPLDEVKRFRLEELAAARWERETAGIVFDGAFVPTDDRGKLLFGRAHARAQADPAYSVEWKVGPGAYVHLDAAAIVAIGDFAERYIQELFAAEKVHAEAIAALASVEAVIAHDIGANWPRNTNQPPLGG